MSIVHFTTELSGGAGAYAKNIHRAMLRLNEKSVLLTRDRSAPRDKGIITIKPESKLELFTKNICFLFLKKTKLVNEKYAVFGIEKTPVRVIDIEIVLKEIQSKIFIFYWVSRFIDTNILYNLKERNPDAKFLFVCLDDAFLTGGCHYTFGCCKYTKICEKCPSTKLHHRQNLIKQEQEKRRIVYKHINPTVIYPSTQLSNMGNQSVLLKKLPSLVMTLGAFSENELKFFKSKSLNDNEIVLLIRSSGEYRKGCDLFFEAIKSIYLENSKVLSNFKLLSIGDNTLTELGICNYIDHFHYGIVDRKKLISIYSNSDALVITSREDAGPIMINEFVALNKFVISTPVGVSKDLIKDNKNGIITNDFSIIELKKSLIDFIFNHKVYISRLNLKDNIETNQITFDSFAKNLINKSLSQSAKSSNIIT